MSKSTKELVYSCIQPQKIKEITLMYKDSRVAEHIEDLYELILFQLKEIHAYRSGTIAETHRNAWRYYDDIVLNKEKIND